MSSSTIDIHNVYANDVSVTPDALSVELMDGRTISIPLNWYPRLVAGTKAERDNWRFIGTGQGIHWPDLDEDISVESLLLGLPSQEKQSSLARWLASRVSNNDRI